MQDATPTQDACQECGTCCRKGGPALHKDDLPLFEKGILSPAAVITLRKGEMVHDQIKGNLVPLAAEMLKVKDPGQKTWRCPFLGVDNRCTTYADRPVECAALACWDIKGLAGMYDKDRITRADVLDTQSAIWELIEAHERRCDYDWLDTLAMTVKGGDREAVEEFLEIVRYDAAVRDLVCEKTGTPRAHLDFYFGRPLTATVHQFGLKIVTKDGKTTLESVE